MIISTSKSDAMLKRTLGKNQVSVISIEKIVDQLGLDPNITNPVKDAFIITNEDISSARIKQKFEQAVACKHPAVKIILINKSSKPVYPNGLQGVNAILQKPKPNEIAQVISAVLAGTIVSDMVDDGNRGTTYIPEYNEQPIEETEFRETQTEQPVAYPTSRTVMEPTPVSTRVAMTSEPEAPAPVEPIPEDLPVTPVQEYVPTPPPQPVYEKPSTIVERIKATGNVTDIRDVMRSISSATLLKEMAETNATYAGIEEKLKSLTEVIRTIMDDTRIPYDEKQNKVYAVLHDKAFWREQGATLIEQRVEEIISVLCYRSSELLQKRLDEIDKAIQHNIQMKDSEFNSARLSGLNEQRANIIIELRVLEQELIEIMKYADILLTDTATAIAEEEVRNIGDEEFYTRLKARGQLIVGESTLLAVQKLMELSSTTPDKFKDLRRQVVNMIKLLNRLLDMDNEIIAAQQKLIEFMKSKNIEDTVIAKSLLKQSLRVYVGEEGTGRTIIPYLMSKYKSRQNANVLLIDLTGESKLHNYGIQYTSLDTYCNNMPEHDFVLAVGKIDNSIEAAQYLVNTLLKAADFYKVINIVMRPDQKNLFRTIAQDVLSVNYITDTNLKNINSMRNLIEETRMDNVGQRVILNKCEVPIMPIIRKLGVEERLDVQVCTIKNCNALIDASINTYNPYGISSVDLAMEVVVKHA